MNMSSLEYRQMIRDNMREERIRLLNKEKIDMKAYKLSRSKKEIDLKANNKLLLSLSPVSKPRQTRSDKWQQRDCVMKYRDFADKVRLEAERQNFKLSDNFEVRFYIPIPRSVSKKKRLEMMGKYHQAKPDIDNLLKAVMDALIENDQSVYRVTAMKFWDAIGSIIIINEGE